MDIFHFVKTPFTREVPIEQRFKVDSIDRETKELQRVIESRQSAALAGPAGSGKSVILRALVAALPEARYQVVYLKLANLGARDMCRQIALGLQLPGAGSYPLLVRNLEEKLQAGFVDHGMRQVLIFDDAHEMRPEAIRLLRLLTNYEMDSKLFVSVILAGHLSLKKIVMSPDLEDIKQRLSYCAELCLLSREESKAYIQHRVKIAGASRNPFANDAIDGIFEITHGNMRAIDKIAYASLQVSASAGREVVSASEVAVARTSQWM